MTVDDDSSLVVETGFVVAESYHDYHFKGALQFDPDFVWAPTFCLFNAREDYPLRIDKKGERVSIQSPKQKPLFSSFVYLLPFPNSSGGLIQNWDKTVLEGGFLSKDNENVLSDTSMLHSREVIYPDNWTDFSSGPNFGIENAYPATAQQIPARFYDWVRRVYPINKSNFNKNLEGRIVLSPETAGIATAWAIRMFEKDKFFRYLPPN